MQILIAVFAVLFTLSGCATTKIAAGDVRPKGVVAHADTAETDIMTPAKYGGDELDMSEGAQHMKELRLYQIAAAIGVLYLDNKVEENRTIQQEYFCDLRHMMQTRVEVPASIRTVVASTPIISRERHPELTALFYVNRFAESVVCKDKIKPATVAVGRDIVRRIGVVTMPVLNENDPPVAYGIRVYPD